MVARACLVLLAGCAASASARAVVSTHAEFHEVEAAAQPSTAQPATGPTAPANTTGSSTPPTDTTPSDTTPSDTTSTTAGGDTLPAGNGPIVFGMLDGEAALEDAWDRWNNGNTTTYDSVFEIAVLANRARPLAMSDELMVIALARAVEMSACDPERLGRIRLLAIAVATSAHTKELDGELARLADVGPAECSVVTPGG